MPVQVPSETLTCSPRIRLSLERVGPVMLGPERMAPLHSESADAWPAEFVAVTMASKSCPTSEVTGV